MKIAQTILAVATTLICSPLFAETYTFEAVADFSDINAGEVPYYRHNGVNALAINAATEEYRDKFARATLVFGESTGLYDVTITSLGETDGDGEFRFLVDGVVVGSGINIPASVDYGQQQHTFENISIPTGALIGVESIAVSNGMIPEGNAFAYARGRWTTLTITTVEDDTDVNVDTPDPQEIVDLSLDLSVNKNTATTGDTLTYDVFVENLSDYVATNPILTINFPDTINNAISENCNYVDQSSMSCALAELGANEKTDFTITATAGSSGQSETYAEITADQPEQETSNNSDSASLEIQDAVAIIDDTVDLALTLSANTGNIEVGDSVTYTVAVENKHESNTATSPVVGIALPASLQFEASDTCTTQESTVTCNTEELPPGASTQATFTTTAISANSYSQLLATASSAQPDSIVTNNEAQLVTDISPETPSNVVPVTDQPIDNNNATGAAEPNSTATASTPAPKVSSGGGTVQLPFLFLLLVSSVLYSRKRYRCR